MPPKVIKTDAEWRAQLTPMQYNVARRRGTERPFTGEYCDHKAAGNYVCVCCGNPLFDSEAKLDSGSGWPSYSTPLSPGAVSVREDYSWLRQRMEVVCAVCDAHLGHLLEDGQAPNGRRYCVNSAALQFRPAAG